MGICNSNVEPLIEDDIDSITELQPAGWEDIAPNIAYYITSDFCFPIKIVIENEIAAIGATIVHNDTAWLGHIIVREKRRGQGIGRLITEKLVDIANSQNCQTIYLIATDLGAPVYEKVGFLTETEYLFFKDLDIENHASAFENIRNYTESDRKAVFEIDRATSGEERMCEIEGHLERGFVYHDKNGIDGFYLPTLREGLIIANSPIAGVDLLKFHLSKNSKVVLPKDNLAGISFLYESGFREFSKAKRMRLGRKRDVRFEHIYNRIAGNIG